MNARQKEYDPKRNDLMLAVLMQIFEFARHVHTGAAVGMVVTKDDKNALFVRDTGPDTEWFDKMTDFAQETEAKLLCHGVYIDTGKIRIMCEDPEGSVIADYAIFERNGKPCYQMLNRKYRSDKEWAERKRQDLFG